MKWRQAIYQIESLQYDYKDTQQHEKRDRNHKNGPVRNKTVGITSMKNSH